MYFEKHVKYLLYYIVLFYIIVVLFEMYRYRNKTVLKNIHYYFDIHICIQSYYTFVIIVYGENDL